MVLFARIDACRVAQAGAITVDWVVVTAAVIGPAALIVGAANSGVLNQ